MVRSWDVRDVFGQELQVRLTDDGALQKRSNGNWELVRRFGVGEVIMEDIEAKLRSLPGVSKVTRKWG